MPTITVNYERDEADVRRIAVDSDHPLESPYRQACIKWVAENPIPENPNDFPLGTVFKHNTASNGPIEYVALGGTEFLRNQDGFRGIRTRSRDFWDLSRIEIVFKS